MEVICLEEEAFYKLLDEVLERVKSENKLPKEDKWISSEEAMQMLRITSKTTLGALRSGGKIRYAQPMKKVLLYDRDSILEYIESNTFEKF